MRFLILCLLTATVAAAATPISEGNYTEIGSTHGQGNTTVRVYILDGDAKHYYLTGRGPVSIDDKTYFASSGDSDVPAMVAVKGGGEADRMAMVHAVEPTNRNARP
jgi:hypothetical protein